MLFKKLINYINSFREKYNVFTEAYSTKDKGEMEMERGNVLVIGNSGVGKSTLINAVLGEDVAMTGWGTEGTTKELKTYESSEIPFRVIDSVGFEPSLIKGYRAVNAVQKWSKDAAKKAMKTIKSISSGFVLKEPQASYSLKQLKM